MKKTKAERLAYDAGFTDGFRIGIAPLEKEIRELRLENAGLVVTAEHARGDGRLDVLEAFVEVLERATDGKRRP